MRATIGSLTVGTLAMMVASSLGGGNSPSVANAGTRSPASVLPPIPRLRACPDAAGAFLCRHSDAGTAPSRFTSLGVSYTHVSKLDSGADIHDNLLPGVYSADTMRHQFEDIASHGYNTVRLFISPLGKGTLSDGTAVQGVAAADEEGADAFEGLSLPYLRNVLQAMRFARSQGLYLHFVFPGVPTNKHYSSITEMAPAPGTTCAGPVVTAAGVNVAFFDRNAIRAKASYVASFLRFFRKEAPELMTTIAFVEVEEKASLDVHSLPFTAAKGTLRGPDGLCYDLADQAQRQRAADAAAVYFADTVTDAVRAVDADALPTVSVASFLVAGFSGPNGYQLPGDRPCFGPSEGIHHVPFRAVSLLTSKLPLVSLHVSPFKLPGTEYDLSADMASFQFPSFAPFRTTKPLLLGELGIPVSGMTADEHEKAPLALRSLLDRLIITYGMENWNYFTWNSNLPTTLSAVADGYALSNALTGALPPPLVTAGPFRIGIAMFKSDGVHSFCRYRSHADFQLAHGALPPARVAHFRYPPPAMTDAGACGLP